jgi:hypothetical protein
MLRLRILIPPSRTQLLRCAVGEWLRALTSAARFAELAHPLRRRIAVILASPPLYARAARRAIERWSAEMLLDGAGPAALLAGVVDRARAHRPRVALDGDGDRVLHVFALILIEMFADK